MLQLEFDYGNMMRTLQKMNFDNEVLICEENQIVLSNTKHGKAQVQTLKNWMINKEGISSDGQSVWYGT